MNTNLEYSFFMELSYGTSSKKHTLYLNNKKITKFALRMQIVCVKYKVHFKVII